MYSEEKVTFGFEGNATVSTSQPLSLHEEILVAIRRITRAIDLHSRTLLQDYGLTCPQLAALNAIARLQPITASAIAREVHLGQPTVTGILNRLEKRGLIQRSRGGVDRRNVHVTLTGEGSRIRSDAPSLLQDQFQDRLGRLQEWERTQILATLQRVAAMMDAATLDAAPVLGSEVADATTGETALHFEEADTHGLEMPRRPEPACHPTASAHGVEPCSPAPSLKSESDQGLPTVNGATSHGMPE